MPLPYNKTLYIILFKSTTTTPADGTPAAPGSLRGFPAGPLLSGQIAVAAQGGQWQNGGLWPSRE